MPKMEQKLSFVLNSLKCKQKYIYVLGSVSKPAILAD